MTYNKPKDVRYVDMCIYVDEHIYNEDRDDNLLFQYIYHIANMIAHRRKYFDRARYYDEYSLYVATKVYMRYLNKKQFELDERGNPKLGKIKSILNYIKSISYAKKVEFEQQFYAQTFNNTNDFSVSPNNFKSSIASYTDSLCYSDYILYLGDISKTIRHYVYNQKYLDKEIKNEIYLSCLLSFISFITLSNKVKERIRDVGLDIYSNTKVIDKLYAKERDNFVVLYGLDNNYYNLIHVLVMNIKHLVTQDLNMLSKSYMISDGEMQHMLMQSVGLRGI